MALHKLRPSPIRPLNNFPILCILAVSIFLLGCVSEPVGSQSDFNNNKPTKQMVDGNLFVEYDRQVEPVQKDIFVNIRPQSLGIVATGKNVSSKNWTCYGEDVCTVTFEYTGLDKDVNLHIVTSDFNLLNDNVYPANISNFFTVALAKNKTINDCIFTMSYDQRIAIIENYKNALGNVCSSVKKLEILTGLPVHKNYALIITFDEDYEGEYIPFSNVIFYSLRYPSYANRVLIHEVVHSLTEKANFPRWLNEGLSEYYSYKVFFEKHKKTGYIDGLDRWIYDKNYVFYDSAHTAVQNFTERYGDQKLMELMQYFIQNPLEPIYDRVTPNNEIIFTKMRELTGDNNLTSVKYLANN